MKMARKFRALEEKMSPEARAWVDKRAKQILREMLARHTSVKEPKE